ncbi:MAG: fused signal recognition particle receptor [Thermosediminibacterales bacterium]|nr:fused signal recognition particle receptor [Thermosediminibacterales bacterium]
MSIFDKLKKGLAKTKKGFTEKLDNLIRFHTAIDDDLLEEIEELLISSDVGVSNTLKIMDDLKEEVKKNKSKNTENIKNSLKKLILDYFKQIESEYEENVPKVVMVVGVNGVGKTTTIGKLANFYKNIKKKKVLLAAGDTFRAAAIDQLEVWSRRVGVDLIKHQEGSDPSAVIYDAIQAAKSRNVDVLICDTAGRLHTKKNLMAELKKIYKIIRREYSLEEIEVLLILDATTGQNAISQVKLFRDAVDITGIVLTKLDGTAKGGIVIAISSEFKIPVRFIGLGEGIEDLQEFEAERFVEALFS